MLSEIRIKRFADGRVSETEDAVIKERRADIFVNGKRCASLLCLPQDLDELAVGFVFSEGIVGTDIDVENLPKIKSGIELTPDEVVKMAASFERQSELFFKTGAVHSCAMVFPEGTSLFYEDIGRSNAVDKAIGKALIDGLKPEEGILVSSGRVTSEIILKAARLRIPVVISVAAPTDKAVEIAVKTDVTLIGFARGNRFNVYSGGGVGGGSL
ncbi:MAG: formate dehydrogenase accessory sulfurtransferase FdhD [Clostridiales bacterium]|nr:formate dehydrogenase accessory sulfurtransferase FdhD [Clostridiales bacterium]